MRMKYGLRTKNILLFSTGFMILSLLFQNCSSRLGSQLAQSEGLSSAPADFSEQDNIIFLNQKPPLISNKTNDVIRFEVSASKINFLEHVEYQLNSDDWQRAYDNEIILTGLSYGEQSLFIRATSNTGTKSEILES